MDMTRQNYGDVAVITCLEDRLDAVIAVQFKDKFRELSKEPAARFVLDMSRVAFMDSSGLGAVVAVYKSLNREIGFELAEPTSLVDRVFRLTRMDTVFAIHDSLADALRLKGDQHDMRTAS